VVKKKLNIPIGDVDIDHDYEKNVSANFTLPSNFIRRVGDEADLLLDYIMDVEDEVSPSARCPVVFSFFNVSLWCLVCCLLCVAVAEVAPAVSERQGNREAAHARCVRALH
jgi:hypothetical protein